MRKMIVIFGLVILSSGLSAQVSTDSINRRSNQQLRKNEQYANLVRMIDHKSFVLEANYLSNSWGNRVIVPSTLNFISVDSANAVIQVGSNWGIGYNGVGGITAKGMISNWKLIQNAKHKNFTLSMTVMSPIGVYDVVMYIGADGYATATVSGMYPGRLIYDGQLVSSENTRVYEGTSV